MKILAFLFYKLPIFLWVYYLFQTFVKSFLQMSNRGSGLLPVVLIRFVYSQTPPRRQQPKLKCEELVVACSRWLLNSIVELKELGLLQWEEWTHVLSGENVLHARLQ